MKYNHDSITPYNTQIISKKQQVKKMFNNVANTYDKLNRILSFRVDIIWRKKIANHIKKIKAKSILDIATGTGDLAIAIAKKNNQCNIIGIDIAENMILIANKKIKDKNLSHLIETQIGDAENLKFKTNSFDAVTVSFGIRNFENLDKGLIEIYNVLKPNGQFIILEFSNPKNFLIRFIYSIYGYLFINNIGKILSNDKEAYNYLNKSSTNFPAPKKLKLILEKHGFKSTIIKPLTFGVCTLYITKK